jgi:hypothetical protein
MCPACVTTLALMAAGAGSAGGVAAVVLKKLGVKRAAKDVGPKVPAEAPAKKEEAR